MIIQKIWSWKGILNRMDYNECIPLRPHHGLCIPHYTGYGYDARFVKNMDDIIDHFNDHPDQKIVLRISADVLCLSCPNNQHGSCNKEKTVALYDRSCLTLCGFSEGQQLKWGDFLQAITKTLMETSQWERICGDCQWLQLCQKTHSGT